jgi:hypothetical protein
LDEEKNTEVEETPTEDVTPTDEVTETEAPVENTAEDVVESDPLAELTALVDALVARVDELETGIAAAKQSLAVAVEAGAVIHETEDDETVDLDEMEDEEPSVYTLHIGD